MLRGARARTHRLAGAVLAFAAFAAACGSQETDGPETVSSAATTQPTKLSGLQEYQSIQAMADELNRFGQSCIIKPLGGFVYPVDSGSCEAYGRTVVLAIYASQERLDEQVQTFDLFREAGLDYGILAGKNWTIDCGTRPVCDKIHDDMGGSISAALPVAATPTP